MVLLTHPQGCRTYLLVDPASGQAMAIDVHLDLVDDAAELVARAGWSLRYVVDTHTHADHPSGSMPLAARVGGTRIAHERSQHRGVARHPKDGEELHLGDRAVTVRHAPGHTPDHIVLVTDAAVFAGDTLFIGGVARTDFLGGDAGQLFDSIHRVFDPLPDATVLFPGHDYQGRRQSTLGAERRDNPWLRLTDRARFVEQLVANPPPRPANMDDLLRLNREGVEIPPVVDVAEAMRFVAAGGGGSVLDVRTGGEFDGEHIKGSRLIPLDQLNERLDEVRGVPAPRLLLCRTGSRAEMAREALERLHVAGLRVVVGGLEAWKQAGGEVEKGEGVISVERQVRIIAGSMAALSVPLGALVHPWCYGIAAFVGVGLIIAGVFDWCGMGLLLAKAPWNKGKGSAAAGPFAACAASAPPSCAAGPVPGSTDERGVG